MAKDPQTVATKWANNASQATQAYTEGVQAVTMAPGRAAAAAADLWAANVAAAKPKFTRNVSAVSLEDWKTAAVQKGAPRIATGVQSAQSKMANFYRDFLPFLDSVRSNLPPRGGTEQNITRAVAMMRGVAGFRKSG